MICRTDRQLQAVCKRWQKILRLEDWDVTAKLVTSDEIKAFYGDDRELFAAIRRGSEHGNAEIQVLRFSLDNPDRDHEVDVVHELLHLRFDLFDAVGEARELGINRTADALVRLSRHG
jgi:hypothetical protein